MSFINLIESISLIKKSQKIVLKPVENIKLFIGGKSIITPAKIDTGNEGYNVLHGTDIIIKNGYVKFKTIDEQEPILKIIELVDINIGANQLEKRPVVEIDMILNGQKHNGVRFSIGNRKSNTEKCLIGLVFLQTIDCVVKP
jgi:hypothetical protein